MASLIERRKMMQAIAGAAPPFQVVTRLVVPSGAYVDSGMRADTLLNMTLQGLVYREGAANGFGALTTVHGQQRYHMDAASYLWFGGSTQAEIRYIFGSIPTQISVIRPSEGYYSIDGVPGSFSISDFDCYINMILFARGREGSDTREYASWYLYGRIYLERLGVERDYYPAICTEAVENARGVIVPAGTAGLWNKIDNSFWTSDSATAFQYDL